MRGLHAARAGDILFRTRAAWHRQAKHSELTAFPGPTRSLWATPFLARSGSLKHDSLAMHTCLTSGRSPALAAPCCTCRYQLNYKYTDCALTNIEVLPCPCSPVVYVHTASEMGVEEGSLHYETGPDTLMVVLQGWGRQQGQQGQGPGAKQQLQATAAEGRSTGCGAGARQDAAGGEAGAGVGRGVPAHVHGGLGAVAAAAGGAGQAGGGQGGTGARTVVVGRVEQILGFTHGVGTKQG